MHYGNGSVSGGLSDAYLIFSILKWLHKLQYTLK